MDENIEPIYDFKALRDFLIAKGYIVEKGQAYREIRPEEVTVDAISKGEIEFTDEGIYVMGLVTKDSRYIFTSVIII